MTDKHERRIVALAAALAPHQQKYDSLDELYKYRQTLHEALLAVDEQIRVRMVDLYDGMTIQVIQAEMNR